MTYWVTAGSAALFSLLLSLSIAAADKPAAQDSKSRAADIERGRYLVKIGGCNDCHTPGYMQTAGRSEERRVGKECRL